VGSGLVASAVVPEREERESKTSRDAVPTKTTVRVDVFIVAPPHFCNQRGFLIPIKVSNQFIGSRDDVSVS
jgi:hypothetical protein